MISSYLEKRTEQDEMEKNRTRKLVQRVVSKPFSLVSNAVDWEDGSEETAVLPCASYVYKESDPSLQPFTLDSCLRT